MEDLVKNVFKYFTIFLALIGTFCISLLVYFKIVNATDTQISGAFIGNQIDPLTSIEYPLLEVQVNQNKSGKGVKTIDVRLNGFSESTYQTIYSRGIQLVTDNQGNETIYYYDSNNGTSFASAGQIGVDYKFPIKINNQNYGIALTGTYEKVTSKFSFKKASGTILANIFSFGLVNLVTSDSFYDCTEYERTTINYTFIDFVRYCERLANSQTNGYGSSYISAIDLSEFFSLYKYENGTYSDVIQYNDTNQSMYYFNANVSLNYNGTLYAKQSLFNIVADDSQYNTSGNTDVGYWKSAITSKISQKDIVKRVTNNGVYISLSDNFKLSQNSFTKEVLYDFDINLDDEFFNDVIGIDYLGFSGINFNTINIESDDLKDFNLLSFWNEDCSINNFNVSSNITLSGV